MRKVTGLLLITFLLASAIALFAQDGEEKKVKPEKKDNPPQTLIKGGEITLSGYGAPIYRFSPVGETYGHFVGGRGGLIINDNFVIGGGGFGLVYPERREKISGETYTGIEPYLQMGYGGGMLEYYFSPKSLIHFSVGVLIGAGGLTFTEIKESNDENNNHGDAFFVAEPEINLFVNVTRFLRIGAGVSYRYVYGINSEDISDNDFRGPTGSIICAFGWF